MEKNKSDISNIICIYDKNGKDFEFLLHTIYENFLTSELDIIFNG